MKISFSKRKIAAVFSAATFAFICSTSYANYACSGPIQQVEVGPGGDVNATFNFLNGGGQWMHVCNVNTQDASSVNPASCKSILSVLLLAKATQQPVTVWFNNTTGGCSFNAWSNLSDYGWYWGPSVGT